VAEKFDAIVVGAGPAGLSAAYLLAKEGLSVICLERGDFAGAKNVMGGVLYRQPTEEILPPGFWKEAPLERAVVEQRAWILSPGSAFAVSHRSQAFAEDPPNCFTVLRARFDKWFAEQAKRAGVLLVPETVVEGVIRKGEQVVGVATGRANGEVYADVVIAADGVNSLLAREAGLHKELEPRNVALAVKEIIALPSERIEDRFNVRPGQGVTMELFGDATAGLVGTSFIYTNNDSVSVGVGALLSDFVEFELNANDVLERLKAHPAVAPLLEGGETREYVAHLIPEGGYHGLSRLSTGGLLVVGDAAGFVNSLHREGSNLAMISAKLAVETVKRAREWGDYSAASLAYYDQLVADSFILKDLYKYRNFSRFFERHHEFFTLYPELLNLAARQMLTVDGTSKRQKQKDIFAAARKKRPLWRMARDLWGAWRSV
jgi:electron transfer flavoprotein-quinone oxidoreductase